MPAWPSESTFKYEIRHGKGDWEIIVCRAAGKICFLIALQMTLQCALNFGRLIDWNRHVCPRQCCHILVRLEAIDGEKA